MVDTRTRILYKKIKRQPLVLKKSSTIQVCIFYAVLTLKFNFKKRIDDDADYYHRPKRSSVGSSKSSRRSSEQSNPFHSNFDKILI